jgi:hypothetical protein
VPVFRGELSDKGNCTELVGVVRPTWLAWSVFVLPICPLILGLLPDVHARWQILGAAPVEAVALWWWAGPIDPTGTNRRQRNEIVAQLESIMMSKTLPSQ